MIINLAGTNGSGKSTIVRGLIKGCVLKPEYADHRKTPTGYKTTFAGNPLYLIGAYEVGTGGADTIKRFGVEPIFEMIERKAREGFNVIYEGAFVMNHTRGPELLARAKKFGCEFHILLLTTPLEVCIQSIQARRAETSFNSPAAQRKNIEGSHQRALNYATKMRRAGARVHRVSRADGLEILEDLLS